MDEQSVREHKILVVDDQRFNVLLLVHQLTKAGFEVLTADDGQDALDKLQTIKPDLILLDVMMPELDGFETCLRLKQDEGLQDIPVIFMTTLATVTDKVKGFEVGAVDYVTKPFQLEEVLARINTHLTIQDLRRDLQEQTSALKESNNQLDAFSRTVAHDLRDPLGTMIGFTRLLQKKARLPDDLDEMLDIILQTGRRMNNIIDELLLLANVQAAEVPLKPIDMGVVVSSSQGRLRYMLEEYKAEVIIATEWPIGIGYAPWVEEVWVNYLSNAAKYGGRPPRIEMGATLEDEGHIRFWVKDNGAGLTEEEQGKLFTEFTRLEHVVAEGHGLGLSIVQRIMQKLGGHFGLESELGVGSTFYFTLPAADVEVEA